MNLNQRKPDMSAGGLRQTAPSAGELLRRGTASLRQAGLDQPWLEAGVLLAHAWGCSREEILVHPEREAPEVVAREFLAMVGQRAEGVPAAYLTGAREFMSLAMVVTPAVLVPRPETELLVEEVLRWLPGAQCPAPESSAGAAPGRGRDGTLDASFRINPCYKKKYPPRAGEIPNPAAPNCLKKAPFERRVVADVGTGSGAIAVSLAYYNPAVRVVATDISEEALRVAAVNARRHGVSDRVHLLAGDLLAPLLERGRAPACGRGAGAAAVANLPYIPTAALDRLPPEVQREPRLALDGGGDGLDLYRRLLPQAAAWLAPGGLLACEIGEGQGRLLAGMLAGAGWRDARVLKDYRGEDRLVTALRGGN